MTRLETLTKYLAIATKKPVIPKSQKTSQSILIMRLQTWIEIEEREMRKNEHNGS